MTQAQQPTALPPPRLVRFLSELAVADIAVSHKNFTERLGRLVDLSGSIALARVHGTLATTTATSGQETGAAVSGESMIEAFLARRAAIIESISKSFAPGKRSSWSAFPGAMAATPAGDAASYERYKVFYLHQQREIASRLDELRAAIRAALAARSSRLARLAVLDATLDETLSAATQKVFCEVPGLLGRRFQYLYRCHQQKISGQQGEDLPQSWVQPGGWLDQFAREMQGSLLAELEARLQPLVGLLEALDEEVNGS